MPWLLSYFDTLTRQIRSQNRSESPLPNLSLRDSRLVGFTAVRSGAGAVGEPERVNEVSESRWTARIKIDPVPDNNKSQQVERIGRITYRGSGKHGTTASLHAERGQVTRASRRWHARSLKSRS